MNRLPLRAPRRALRSVALALAAAALTGTARTAGAEGANVIAVGIVHIDPRSSSGPLTLSEFGGQPVNQPQAGTGVRVRPANTVLLSFEHDWTEALSSQFVFGYPPTHELEGTGTLAAVGVIGDGQQLSPAILLKYHFRDADQRFRPYLGIGVNHTSFRRSRTTNDAFRQATYGPDATTSVSASSSWNAVYNAGLDVRLDPHWVLGLSLGYAPLRTRITVAAEHTASGVPLKVTTDVRMRTAATGMTIGYRF